MDELTSGLATLAELNARPPCLRVTWIAWDSPFRGRGLLVGDRVVAVNEVSLSTSTDPAQARRNESELVGGYAEAQGFARAGLVVGAPLALTVRRRASPRGWTELKVTAALGRVAAYRDANNAIVLGDGGPNTMASDGFSESWGSWYERLVKLLSRVLDADQRQTPSFVSRYEAKNLRDGHGARVAFARQRFPGAWSQALGEDYDAALSLCEGRRIELSPGALEFRRRGEVLAAELHAQALTAWAEFQARRASEFIPAFPAVSPVRGDVRPVTGRLVLLPPLGNSDWIEDAGHGWFVASGTGCYVLDAESGAARAMLTAQRRYARRVDPNLAPRWEFIARINGESRLVVVGGRAQYGLLAVPEAALVGGAMVVDLTQATGAEAMFAGETGLVKDTVALPPADASPGEVVAALVSAVKNQDLSLWRSLHAGWEVERRAREDGGEQLIVHPCAPMPNESMFEESRRSVLGRVLDAQVVWEDDPRTLVDGARYAGATTIDEAEVWLEHVGEFDGERRTFCDVTVRPRWTLQRVNGGPWRIATAQPI